jgi:Reverse transcriptase (RNA-dependent DNA polymerase)
MEEAAGLATVSLDNEPKTFVESQTRTDSEQWKEAVLSEWGSLEKNETWMVVKKPEGLRERDIVSSRWVFKIKRDSNGDIERYKARLVARGYQQTEGLNYEETFAPVAKMNSIRIILSIGAAENLELDHMDVKTAYLNSTLARKDRVYMYPPKDGEIGTVLGPDEVLLVHKGLYGFKTSAMNWYGTADVKFVSFGFKKLHGDHSIYVKFFEDGSKIYIALYVDDLVLASNSRPKLDSFKHQLAEAFEMTDLGDLHWFLGIRIIRDRIAGTLSIDQSRYIDKILEQYGMSDCKGVSTPMEPGICLTRSTEDEVELNLQNLCQQMTGSLIYAMIGTRVDISFAVSALSRYCSKPAKRHLNALVRVLRYLKSTKNHAIVYGRKSGIFAYMDSDYAGDRDERRSTTGYAVIFNGGSVAFKSKLQKTIVQSSTEGEYQSWPRTDAFRYFRRRRGGRF